ncbi:N-acetylmuramidase family protein [Aquamicrobium zhengzhouense]|uniref:N-acetylmuramidase family protein n=1 Tax=Aquamicrobium zhengzhouense TaxID=2781738 RepID=A0ABS0S8S3_9HYPH|nr:N-acetylmuramidase family protein [Aquamicrobium zhengzhouense]MBI1619694.1 N-acetylmuramidase family protein [Aquamicrobium zhengzhouense]
MMQDEAMRQAIAEVARTLKVPPAAFAAVVKVECGGRAHALVRGRKEPMIRFEGHYFDRRLSGVKRERARSEGLSSPQVGGVPNPASQTARWNLLARAAQIDRKAAYEATSWGVGQVMGAHWAWLGYGSVDSFVDEARNGLSGQLRVMAKYISQAGLAPALQKQEWADFARGYNGPGYRRNRYDARLAAAYEKYADTDFDFQVPTVPELVRQQLPGTTTSMFNIPIRFFAALFSRRR